MDSKTPYPIQASPNQNPPPPNYLQSTQQTHNPNNIVILQPIAPSFVGSSPMNFTCPNCRHNVLSRVHYSTGALAWLICAGMCLFGFCCGCQFIPFCIDSCKDVEHYCPNCSQFLGMHRKL